MPTHAQTGRGHTSQVNVTGLVARARNAQKSGRRINLLLPRVGANFFLIRHGGGVSRSA